jgi:hypothetical protein
VTIEADVETKFTGDHEHGFDTVAEIPGTDPELKDQVVMVGGHLDSWIAGTGATDNGAGSIVAMEVMRILKALDVHPRRTIRIALWTGEEQGLFGSVGYAKEHFGSAPETTDPEQLKLPSFMRAPGGPLELKPEQKLISGYFNLDNGTGKIRGIYLQQNLAVKPIFEQWMAPLKDLGVTTITAQNTGGTDHLSFDAVGIPGFQFIQDPMDYETRTHHSNMDTFERLQAADLKQAPSIAQWMGHFVVYRGSIARLQSSVQSPYREVENAGEADPGEVGHEEPASGFTETEKENHRPGNGKPQESDFHDAQTDLVMAKENEAPEEVDRKLDAEPDESDSPDAEDTDAASAERDVRKLPDQPRGDGHERVEQRPYGAEDIVGRVEAGLRQGCVPGGNRGDGEGRRNARDQEGGGEKTGESQRAVSAWG